ncbi:MAG: N-acetyl sugar amidotransferase [Chthoniobacterales bacterium]
MKVCRRCLYTSLHPLGLTFNEEGICSGCTVHDEKNLLDWKARRSSLEKLVEGFRNTSGQNYDCIVPVSGARDSFFILHTVKKELGLNPLIVTYNKHYNTDIGVRNLARLRTLLDCDIFTQTVDPDRVKRITRATLRRFGNMYWHCLAGQSVFPVQIAVKMKIPLIIWGHHQGLDQVGMFSHLDEVEMSRRHRRDHDLFRQEADSLVSDFDFVKSSDVEPYRYPHDEEIAAAGVRGIYLGNYIRWDTKAQHERMLDLYDYEAAPQTRTFDTYNDVDCWMHSDVHDYTKWCKWGYGRATDHAVRELRFGRLTREQALAVASHYEEKEPLNMELFLEWIGMTRFGFNFNMDQNRSPEIWKRNDQWRWARQEAWGEAHRLAAQNPDRLPENKDGCVFQTRKSPSVCDSPDRFILIGKGEYRSPEIGTPVAV